MRNRHVHILLLFILLCLAVAGCKKKDGDNHDLEDTNTSVAEYMSTKAGSWWLYIDPSGQYIKRVATGRDSLKMGLVFNFYKTIDSATQHVTPEYFGKNGDKYLSLLDLDGSETNYMKVIVLKDDPQVGDSWTNTGTIQYSGMTFDLLAEGKVISVNQTLTINGHTFSNVTEVDNQLKGKLSISPAYTNCGSFKIWHAKDVGVIRIILDLNILSAFQKHYEHSIIDYHLEP